jgi:thiol-disulfide isomerase/thioredoxin
MKTTINKLVLILILVSYSVTAQTDYAVLSGKILNAKGEYLNLNNLNGFSSRKIKLSENGTFIDTLKVDEGNFMLYDSKYVTYLYVQAGNNINLSYDFNDKTNTIKFSGIGSENNNYLIAKKNKESQILTGTGSVFELDETKFTAKQKEIESGSLELLSKTKNLSKDFIAKEKRNIKYYYLYNLDSYEKNYAYQTKNPDFKTSKTFLKELENLDYNNEIDFNFSYNYFNLVFNHYYKEAEKLANSSSIANDVALMKVLNSATNQSIKNFLLYKNAKFGITITSDLQDYYTAFMKGSTNEENKKVITESYKVLQVVERGKPSPTFLSYENNAGGTTSLGDLNGKYVYIDVWATWCGPCKAEIPFLKKVEEAYHSKNIEFVSISVDKAKDYDKWKKMIVNLDLKGIQLLADKDFDSDFVKGYFIKGIPRFILLDPKGNIIDANAPRPSDPKLINLFTALGI